MTGLKIVQWLAQGHAWSCILFIVWITNGKWRRTNEIMLSFTWRLPIKKMMIPKSTYVPVCNIRNLRKIYIQHLLKQELFFFKLRHSARYPCFTQRQLWVTHSGVVLSRDDTKKKSAHTHWSTMPLLENPSEDSLQQRNSHLSQLLCALLSHPRSSKWVYAFLEKSEMKILGCLPFPQFMILEPGPHTVKFQMTSTQPWRPVPAQRMVYPRPVSIREVPWQME